MSNGASAYVFLNHVNQVPLFECSDTGLVRVLNTKNNNSNFTKVINVRNSEELSKVLVQLTAASKYNYADVVINLTGNKEYTLSPEDYGGLWKRIVNHVNDLDSFLDIGGMLGGLKDWGVSLFTNTKKDEADKFVDAHFCKIKGGMNVHLVGNGATIRCNGDKNANYHLFYVTSSGVLTLDNVTVKGFNSAIINHGRVLANNTDFVGNEIRYFFAEDDNGGAVRNFGLCDFVNCTFGDNSAKYGGVIYNEGSANFIDCIFNNNRGYNKEGRAIYDSKLGRSNIIYSDNSTAFNGTYFLDKGISQIKNCVLYYTANWMSVATMIASIFFAPLEGVSAVISGAVSVGAASAASTWINSYKAVCNHDVHVGNLVWSSVNTAIGHLMMYGLGKTIGKKLFKQNKSDVKAPKEKYAKRDVRIKEDDPYEDIGEKNPNENPQTSSKIRTILDEERENPVSESKNPVSKNKNPKPVKISLSDSDMELGNNIIMKCEQIKWEDPTGVVDKLMPNYNLASIKNYVGQYNDLIRGGCKNPARLVNVVKNINICFNNIKSVLSSRGISVSHVSNFMSFSAVDSIFEPLCVYLDNMMNSINIEFCRIGYYPYG